jgi:nucleoside-diphosphate-sugar epimerase
MKNILILGIDGYIGFPLAIHLLKKGYNVSGVDNYSRRERVDEVDSDSLTPIAYVHERKSTLESYSNFGSWTHYDLHSDHFYVRKMLETIQPDAIIHLAEMPSAPWSMQSAHFCNTTQYENVLSTLNILWTMHEVCPNAHLIKLGTMGEYGVPDCDIPEGEIPEECLGRDMPEGMTCPMAFLPFPRSPNSFYHLSKVHDTHNIIFACRNWGLTSTDIMQGVVFGITDTEQQLLTRLDYDEHFGTVINRFLAQSLINHPLTVYGKGEQTRGYLPLKDSIQCLNIAIDNPPPAGTYRTLNQFERIYSINELANMVAKSARKAGFTPSIQHIPNPRKEAESHYYNPAHQRLFDLGYTPTTDIQGELDNLVEILYPYRERIVKEVIMPKTNWI